MSNGKMDIQNTQLPKNSRGEIFKLKENLKESFEDNGYSGVVAFSFIASAELNALISEIRKPGAACMPITVSSLNKG